MRGIGVAVSTSTSTASPFCVSASRWCTPKRCCSSTMASARSWKATSSWNSAWVPSSEIDVAEREPVEDVLARRPALAAGEDGDADAGRFGQRRDGGEMLAGEDFGRRHEGGLPAGFDHGRRRQQRHHGLAGADIALQQAQHALRLGEVGDDVVDRLLLRMGERIGQRLEDARAQAAFAGAAAAGLPAHMGAHQRERELAGEQFVIGKPRPGRHFPAATSCGSRRPVQMAQRVGKGWEVLARDPGFVLPFRQHWGGG